MNAPDTLPVHAGVEYIPIGQLAGSPTNPRRSFPADKLAEMAESIRRHGVLQPILVRPWPGDTYPIKATECRYEIIAGERRYRASSLAEQDTVPALVRHLTDSEVLEIQIIENLQREDVHPLEEAEGYQVLMLRTGYTADQLAEKVGKSKAYIYARLKLCAICGQAREAFMAGELSASAALLIARIPIPALQERAAKEIMEGRYHGSGPMSAREAGDHVQKNYMLRLPEAPFPRGDAKLVEGAPTCAKCPKRTGNAKDLFPDVKSADVCTDPDCFASKKAAHKANLVAAAEAKGIKVITGHAAEKMAPYGLQYSENVHGDYVTLSKKVWSAPMKEDGTPHTWRELVGDDFRPTLIEDVRRNVLVEIAQEKDLIEAANARGIEIKASASRRENDDFKKKEKAAKEETAYRKMLLDRILFAQAGDPLREADLRAVAMALWDRMGSEGQKLLCKIEGRPTKPEDVYALGEMIQTAAPDYLNRLLLAMALLGQVHVSHWEIPAKKPERLLVAADRWGVDANVVKKQAQFLKAPSKSQQKTANQGRYRHPDDANLTWSGKGQKPNWVKGWLSQGHALEEIEVANA